jgi:hypothetical protein
MKHSPRRPRSRRLTVAAYARHRRVSSQAIYAALAAGRISRSPDGTLDPERCDAEWRANSRARPGADRGETRRRLEELRLEKERLQLQHMKNRLWPRAPVERLAETYINAVRSRMRAWAPALGRTLAAHLSLPVEAVVAHVEREMAALLRERERVPLMLPAADAVGDAPAAPAAPPRPRRKARRRRAPSRP